MPVDYWGPSLRSIARIGDTIERQGERRREDDAFAAEMAAQDEERQYNRGRQATADAMAQEKHDLTMSETRRQVSAQQGLRGVADELAAGVPQAGPTMTGEPLPNRPYSAQETAGKYQDYFNRNMLTDPSQYDDITEKFDTGMVKKHELLIEAAKMSPEYGRAVAASIGLDPGIMNGLKIKETENGDEVSIPVRDSAGKEIATVVRVPDGKGGYQYLSFKHGKEEGSGGGGGQLGDTGSLDPEKITFHAERYLRTGTLPPLGLGKSALREAILNRAAEIGGERGWSGDDAAAAAADYNLSKNPSFRQRGITAEALPEILTSMVDAGKRVGFDDVRLVGRLQKVVKGELNDPALTEYMAIRNDALMEIASVMRMSGVTDKATELESEAANPTMSPRALDAWLKGQMTSLAPRLKRFHRVMNTPGGEKPAAPKVGDVVKGYRFKGGNPAQQTSWEKVQ